MSDHGSSEMSVQDGAYEPQDALGKAIKSTVMVGGAGLFFSAIRNTVAKENVGAMGVFTRFGSTTALFATVGGTYAFVSTASANLRQTHDEWNAVYGGLAAGAIGGLRRATFQSVVGGSAALAVVLGVATYTGTSMFGTSDVHPEGRWPTKEEMRKRFRRPVNETINELGEGRGIYGPGYEERRAQRIKEAYGIDVPKPFWETREAAEPMKEYSKPILKEAIQAQT